jgi:hypothetical protein
LTEGEVLELALHGATVTADERTPGVCGLCGGEVHGELLLCDPWAGCKVGQVHASCAAPVLARAHKAAGREPMRRVSGIVCGICKHSFRELDQVVVMGRDGSKTAVHVRRCTRQRVKA